MLTTPAVKPTPTVNQMAKAPVKMPSKKQVEKSAADKKDDKAMRAGKKPGKKMPC